MAQWRQASTRRRLPRVREKGVLSGKRVERSERGQPGEFEFLEKMSPEELEAYARGELVMPDEQERLH